MSQSRFLRALVQNLHEHELVTRVERDRMRLALANMREDAAVLLREHSRSAGVYRSCAYRDRADAYLANQLVPVERDEYESHFQNCLVCIEAVENARFLRAMNMRRFLESILPHVRSHLSFTLERLTLC